MRITIWWGLEFLFLTYLTLEDDPLDGFMEPFREWETFLWTWNTQIEERVAGGTANHPIKHCALVKYPL